MNCFKHNSVSAIGICKFCGKGVCRACATDTGHGLACRDSCEEQVNVLARIVKNNARVLRAANAQVRSSGLFAFAMGLAFLCGAWWGYDSGVLPVAIIFFVFGFLFSIFGLKQIAVERFPNPGEQKQQD